MAAQQAGVSQADSNPGADFGYTAADAQAGNAFFNQGSVNNGTLGTELAQGTFSGPDFIFDTNPTFTVDQGGLGDIQNPLNNQQNPNAPQGGSQPASGAAPAASAKKIADIKSILLRPATTSHYVCAFSPPPSVEGWETDREKSGLAGASYFNKVNTELIQLLCCDASLPGSTLATHDINNDFHGMTQKNAYRRLYDDRADFTFYVDRNYTTLRYFEGWISYIVNEQLSGSPSFTDNFFFSRVNYPKNYKCDTIYITKFEKDVDRKDAGPVLEYRFFEAFPISISSMPISYEASQLLKCTVSFTFSKYLINYKRPSAPSKSPVSQAAQNAPGVPELNTVTGGSVQNSLNEIRNMQEASKLRQAGFDAMSGGPTGVTVNGLPLYQ